ncbi:MAG TPA: HPr family phosphocarrier protein [Gammaproteobacteria bacterium]|nr:HPr family phosphocarrier protein [Gammaproteobacteria bacterium]
MIRKRVQIINKLGLHARAAAKFVQLASSFYSEIEISHAGKTVNGKSIMGIMMLAASQNTWIELTISGSDAEKAMITLEELIQNRFGESS